MKSNDLRALLSSLLSDSEKATEIAKIAERNGKSLGGNNPYGERFHKTILTITAAVQKVRPHLGGLALPAAEMAQFDDSLGVLKGATGKAKERATALRTLRMVCETVVMPKAEAMTASPVPATEQVLPLAVLLGTRDYFVKIVTQINGCYEHQWYDACSVMLRKLAEILIIAVYEAKNESDEIKGADGNFLMLSKLIENIKTKTAWNLGRDTKTCLDKMKELGDWAAHNRHYTATKPDVDGLISKKFRVAVEDLLHHAGLK
jgi:Domain of unknown function (DUF4145)